MPGSPAGAIEAERGPATRHPAPRTALRPGAGPAALELAGSFRETPMLKPLCLTVSLAVVVSAALLASPAGGAESGTDSRRQEKREARDALRAGDFDAPTTGWREGPVRYILSRQEDAAYRHLETREERAEFIQRFWASRDPDTSTPDNEFRDLFYRRVAFAARAFTTESTKPGWKTDRGKIYILLGPPDDFDERVSQRQDTQAIIWTYRDPPPGTVASPNTQVTFLRDPSGEYRLTSGIRLFSNDSAMSLALALQALQVKTPQELHLNPGSATRSAAPDEFGPTTPPGARDAAGAPAGAGGTAAAGGAGLTAGTGVPLAAGGTGLLRAHTDLFRTGDRRALVVLTVWVKDAGSADSREQEIAVDARLVGEGARPKTYALEGPTALRPGAGDLGRASDGARLFQGGVIVEPGSYTVDYALATTGQTPQTVLTDVVVVPSPSSDAGLAVGPVALASHFERLADSAAPEYSAPFNLGRLRIVPRLDDRISAGEDLSFYYQVLGAATDPIGGRPDLDLEYRLFRIASGGGGPEADQPFGRPIHLTGEQSLLQGFSLVTTGWPPGDYRLQVIVTDNLSGLTASGATGFRLR
jgi:GWxTD domain-containing protein